jgi:F-type H+-transporting ATPase subunit epsilon
MDGEKNTIHLKMATPSEVIFEMDVLSVLVPTVEGGDIKILPKHTPLVTVIKPGALIVEEPNGEKKPYYVPGGFLEVAANRLVILADGAEHVHKLDIDEAKKAAEEAEKLLTSKKYDLKEYEQLQRNLERAKAKVKIGNKWKK